MRSLRGQLRPREGTGQLPALLLDLGSLPSGHQEARVGEQGLRLAKQPRVNRFVLLLLLAGIMLCCVGIFLLSLPLTAPDVSSALGGRMWSMWIEQRMLPLLCRAQATR